MVLAYVYFVAVNVVFRSKENANDRLDVLVAVDCDVIGEGLVVKTVLTRFDHRRLRLFVAVHGHSVADQRVEVVEECYQLVDGDGFDMHAWEDEFLVRVFRQVLLVSTRTY